MQNTERNPVAKSLALLRWMLDADVERIGVRSAAAALGVAPSSAHRIISHLCDAGFLQRTGEDGGYKMGLEFLRLSHRAVNNFSLRRVALEKMRELVARCNEAAFLSLYDSDRQQIMAIESVESTHALRYVVQLRDWKPVHVAAAGWAIMAYLSDAEVKVIVQRTKLAPLTKDSVTDPVVLERALSVVRRRGYSISNGQRIVGAVGIAAPLFDAHGSAIGAIGISMPEQRFQARRETWFAGLVMQCAASVVEETGGMARFRPKRTA